MRYLYLIVHIARHTDDVQIIIIFYIVLSLYSSPSRNHFFHIYFFDQITAYRLKIHVLHGKEHLQRQVLLFSFLDIKNGNAHSLGIVHRIGSPAKHTGTIGHTSSTVIHQIAIAPQHTPTAILPLQIYHLIRLLQNRVIASYSSSSHPRS